jgi:hypothetical protein
VVIMVNNNRLVSEKDDAGRITQNRRSGEGLKVV